MLLFLFKIYTFSKIFHSKDLGNKTYYLRCFTERSEDVLRYSLNIMHLSVKRKGVSFGCQ